MKRIYVLLVVIALTLALATPVMAAGLHQNGGTSPTLPDWAIALLKVGAIWLVTAGIKSLSKALPFVPTLEGSATAVAAAVVALVVEFVNGLLGLIPTAYQPAVIAVFGFIGTLLSAYGVQGTVKMFAPQTGPKVLVSRQVGQGMVEYALILVLVAVVVIAALMLMGPAIANIFSTINASL